MPADLWTRLPDHQALPGACVLMQSEIQKVRRQVSIDELDRPHPADIILEILGTGLAHVQEMWIVYGDVADTEPCYPWVVRVSAGCGRLTGRVNAGCIERAAIRQDNPGVSEITKAFGTGVHVNADFEFRY